MLTQFSRCATLIIAKRQLYPGKIQLHSEQRKRKEWCFFVYKFHNNYYPCSYSLLHVACASDIHIFFSVIKDRRGGKVTEPRSIAEPKQYIYRRCSGRCPPRRSVFWYSARIAKRRASEMRCQVYPIVFHNFILFDTS